MNFSTPVQIAAPPFQIEPLEELLFVGSCFADGIGQRFAAERFPVTVNPFGTMYNPASVLHTIERHEHVPRIVFITLGTNHIYRLKATGEIVDNCQKRPQRLFSEEQLSVDDCAGYLRKAVETLRLRRPDVQVVLTVSPIRYQKYGFHESQLSKATLLLAVDQIVGDASLPASRGGTDDDAAGKPPHTDACCSSLSYFPAYELVLDELRDYRFYKEDMLHPSSQAVDFIWERLAEHYLSPRAKRFVREWKPIREALAHRPFHPESDEYKQFLAETKRKEADLLAQVSQWT